MTWRQYLFGFSGRINRLRYWQFILVSFGYLLVGFALAVPYMAIEHPMGDHPLSPLGMATITGEVILALAFLVSNFSIYVQRLHDRNKSAWWLIPFILIPNILQLAFNDHSGLIDQVPPALAAALALVAVVLTLWAFVEIGFLRGTVGNNRFGPDPLAERA